MFDILVIVYLFLGGAAGGAYFVMAAWSLAFHHRGNATDHRLRQAFKALLSRAYTIATIMLITSLLCLLWDLEFPHRALLILTRPHPTILTFGAFALAVQLLIGSALAFANTFDLSFVNGRMRKALEVLCCVSSIAVMVYTGVFLASNESIPFWNTPWLTLLFLLSSLSSGVSAVLLVDYFTQGQTILLRAAKPLQKMHLACLAFEATALALFLRAGLQDAGASGSLELLLNAEMLATGVIGVIVFGITIPFILESYSLSRKECRTIPFSDVVCLIGSFCLRYCIIMCGIH